MQFHILLILELFWLLKEMGKTTTRRNDRHAVVKVDRSYQQLRRKSNLAWLNCPYPTEERRNMWQSLLAWELTVHVYRKLNHIVTTKVGLLNWSKSNDIYFARDRPQSGGQVFRPEVCLWIVVNRRRRNCYPGRREGWSDGCHSGEMAAGCPELYIILILKLLYFISFFQVDEDQIDDIGELKRWFPCLSFHKVFSSITSLFELILFCCDIFV